MDSEAYYDAFGSERPTLESLDSAAAVPQIRISDREHGQRDWEDFFAHDNGRWAPRAVPPPPPHMYNRPHVYVAEHERREESGTWHYMAAPLPPHKVLS